VDRPVHPSSPHVSTGGRDVSGDFRENGRLWKERLGAEVVLDALRLHFAETLNP
jgi:hypothetical protein